MPSGASMYLASLGSGSRGNATLIRSADTCILIDCGFSLADIQRRFWRLKLDPSDIDAIVVTHEHRDHTSGVDGLAKALGVPVYMSFGTARSDRLSCWHDSRLFNAGDEFTVGDIAVHSVPVPHDAREPVQFRFDSAGARIGLLTDIGRITPHVCRMFQECRALILEFNHDEELLRQGPYPAALKRRIRSEFGHLSNREAVSFLSQTDLARLSGLVIAHASAENNSELHARQALSDGLPDFFEGGKPTLGPEVRWASQLEGTDWIPVSLAD
ncbi:MAG: MBL fold metallo-hydrolase [Pseudomonadota bacterium]